MICNHQVGGSNPFTGSSIKVGYTITYRKQRTALRPAFLRLESELELKRIVFRNFYWVLRIGSKTLRNLVARLGQRSKVAEHLSTSRIEKSRLKGSRTPTEPLGYIE